MLEIIVAVAAVVAMVRIASADNQSPWLWGCVTVGLIILSVLLVPWPLLRIALALVVAFGAMIAYKVAADR